ncbi:eukaryotic aspartyl protease [Ancylostoma caninum]|uniref:Eukaryotic aspartyl protease n=1 Tax=Ancylostoma caninum TaxID=29170 RepID=A0A368FQC5_ANCCA|nr:eukaryotic aspartyl protease [Ancylostoma caninum]
MYVLLALVILVNGSDAVNFTIDLLHYGSAHEHALAKGNFSEFLEEQDARRVRRHHLYRGNVQMYDYFDEYYVGLVSIGTPQQHFYLQMDTGSANLWVVSAQCRERQCIGYPSSHRPKLRFYPSRSRTFKKCPQGFYMYYETGYCSGYYGFDTVRYGGFLLEHQKFGIATNLANVFGYQPIDGIMGLAWQRIAVGNTTAPMTALLPWLDQPLFTVYMGRRAHVSMGWLSGVITFGAIDHGHCHPKIYWVPLSWPGYWQFAIEGFQVGGFVSRLQQQAISDTGTSWLGGPPAAISGIIREARARYSPYYRMYVVPCSTMNSHPDLIFAINGHRFTVPSGQYIIDLGIGGGWCTLAVFPIQAGGFTTQWIMGTPWIRTFCNTYDFGNKRIGFSVARPL